MPDRILAPLSKAETISPVGDQPDDDMIDRYFKNPVLNKIMEMTLGASKQEEIDPHSPRAGMAILGALAGVGGMIKGAQKIGQAWKAADEGITPIMNDVYGLSEAPYDRRNFFYRASGAPKKAAILRRQASPGIISDIASKFDDMKGKYDILGTLIKQPGGGIKQQGQVLGALENEADTIAALHKKHGILNDNLGGTYSRYTNSSVPYADIGPNPSDPMFGARSSIVEDLFGPEMSESAQQVAGDKLNPVARLWNNMSPSTRRAREGTLKFLNRTVPKMEVSPNAAAREEEAFQQAYINSKSREIGQLQKEGYDIDKRLPLFNENGEYNPESVKAREEIARQIAEAFDAQRSAHEDVAAFQAHNFDVKHVPDDWKKNFQKALIEYDERVKPNEFTRSFPQYVADTNAYAAKHLQDFADAVGGPEGRIIQEFVRNKISGGTQNISDEVMDTLAQELGFDLKDLNPAAAARLANSRKSVVGSAMQGIKNRYLRPLPPEKK